MPPGERPTEPWLSFFTDLDRAIGEPVELHCFGGFVVIHAYGVARTTNERLARAGHLERDVLTARYYEELRPYLPNAEWHDQTLQFWLEAYWSEGGGKR